MNNQSYRLRKRTKNNYPEDTTLQLPSLRASNKKNTLGPQASESLLPDNTPLEFRVLLSACRVFLGMEEPAKLEARLQRGPERDMAPFTCT